MMNEPALALVAIPAETLAPDTLSEDLSLVRQIAISLSRRLPRHIELAELIALGNLGLVEARRRYDLRRGVPFGAFAAMRIRGAILDGLRREDLASREERARIRRDENAAPAPTEVALDDDLLMRETEPVDERLCRARSAARLRGALATLPERERTVIERHFFAEEPLRSIGESLGVSESRVCQIVGAVVSRLRASIGAEAVG